MTDSKNWIMITITLVFVSLYTGALLGWFKPLSDVTMVTRLEPIIFTVIGFYFGRMPARENEQHLKEEVERQIKKADAAHSSCEEIKQEREILEEKLKNVQTILSSAENKYTFDFRESKKNSAPSETDIETLRHSLKTAINVLNS